MADSERRGNNPARSTPPVYTVYPVSASPGNQVNFNYGFHQTDPHASPPKYEDVIRGRPGEPIATAQPTVQPAGTYGEPEQAGVIFVAPVYKYTKTQRCLGTIFTVLFVVGFVSVFIKILGVQSHF